MRRRKFDDGAWAERTIRNGAIRFYGKTYRVCPRPEPDCNGFQEPAYDGRLDGKRALFYSYSRLAQKEDSVYLHSFRPFDPESDVAEPNVIGGYIVWERWKETA